MYQKRKIDEHATGYSRPIDYFRAEFDQIYLAMPQKFRHPLELFSAALDVYAQEQGSQAWAVNDIHAERNFAEYRAFIHNLHLIVVLRDPREAVCHAVYWQSYPDRNHVAQQRLEYFTLMWIYTALAYMELKARWPDAVSLFYFNKLIQGDADNCRKMSRLLDLPETCFADCLSDKAVHYNYYAGTFMSPAGRYERLLTRQELSFIEQCTFPLLQKLGINTVSSDAAPLWSTSAEPKRYQKLLQQIEALVHFSPRKAFDHIHANISPGAKSHFPQKLKQVKMRVMKSVRKAMR